MKLTPVGFANFTGVISNASAVTKNQGSSI